MNVTRSLPVTVLLSLLPSDLLANLKIEGPQSLSQIHSMVSACFLTSDSYHQLKSKWIRSLQPSSDTSTSSTLTSAQLKDSGNQFYKSGLWFESLRDYNSALKALPLRPKSKSDPFTSHFEITLLYIQLISNRSATLIQIHRYKEAYVDASEAKKEFNSLHESERESLKVLIQKVDSRLDRIERLLDANSFKKDPLKADRQGLTVSPHLRILYNFTLGRHVKSESFLQRGSLLLSEPGFTTVTLEGSELTRCTFCLVQICSPIL